MPDHSKSCHGLGSGSASFAVFILGYSGMNFHQDHTTINQVNWELELPHVEMHTKCQFWDFIHWVLTVYLMQTILVEGIRTLWIWDGKEEKRVRECWRWIWAEYITCMVKCYGEMLTLCLWKSQSLILTKRNCRKLLFSISTTPPTSIAGSLFTICPQPSWCKLSSHVILKFYYG